MSDLDFKLSRTEIFFEDETVENAVISILTLLFLHVVTTVLLTLLRHRGAENKISLSTYFDFIAFQETFRSRTWNSLFCPRPELDIDEGRVEGTPPRCVANRRMLKAVLIHLLLGAVELAVLILFSKDTKPLYSEHVGVVVGYEEDGLTKIPTGNCIISTPKKRREQLSGVFFTCYEITDSISEPNPGNVTFTMERLHSQLRLGFEVEGKTVLSTISFRYRFERQLDVKLESYVNERVVAAIIEAITATGCRQAGDDIANSELVGCSSLDIPDISFKVASTVGYVGGNYTLGVAKEEAAVFEEAVGVQIGTYTATILELFYLPIIVGICLLLYVVVTFTLTADPQRVINLMLMEKVPDLSSGWGYLFVDEGSVKVKKWQSQSGTEGHLGVDRPDGMIEVTKFSSDVVVTGPGGSTGEP